MTNPRSGTRQRPIIRIFVSSPFSDFRFERDALQRYAFLELERRCLDEGFQFQAIDLRWGVSTEAGLDHRTMRICFEELRRSQDVSPQPNFLILLGNRYGWRPLPEEISEREFNELVAAARTCGEGGNSIAGVHNKSAERILRDWYRCDHNVLVRNPQENDPDRTTLNCILQPRTQDLGDGRDYTQTNGQPLTDTQDWRDVQDVLWNIINSKFSRTKLAQRFGGVDWEQQAADTHVVGRSPDRPTQVDRKVSHDQSSRPTVERVDRSGDLSTTRVNPKRAVPQIVRFQGSATEQEIWAGALTVPAAEQHVLAVFRDINNGDSFAAQDVKDFFDLADNGMIDEETGHFQRQLKEAVAQRLGEKRVLRYDDASLIERDGRLVVDLDESWAKAFGKRIADELWPTIEKEIEQWRTLKEPNADVVGRSPDRPTQADRKVSRDRNQRPSVATAGRSGDLPATSDTTSGKISPERELEIEREEHRRIAEQHTANFVGREEPNGPLQRIADYLNNDSRQPFVIHGVSGCGKTALLARAFHKYVSPSRSHIIRFLGVTPKSSDLRSLLTNLCLELRRDHPLENPIPTEIQDLQQEFRQHLAAASDARRSVILFLDALDQLADTDADSQLFWLPDGPTNPLPEHVKIVVSCLSDRTEGDPAGQPFAALQRSGLIADNTGPLGSLSIKQAKELLFDRWLENAGRTLKSTSPNDEDSNQEAQRCLIEKRVASNEQCRQPLFLKLLFEEVKLWQSYYSDFQLNEPDPTADDVKNSSNRQVDALLSQLFVRLSQQENHGPFLVERALGYLAAARRGLSETEILEVLFADRRFRRSVLRRSIANGHRMSRRPRRIPIAIWSRLRSDLAPYLTERTAPGGNVLTLYHREVAEWVEAHFVNKADWSPHTHLADFFGKQAYYWESLEITHPQRIATQLSGTGRLGGIRRILQQLFRSRHASKHDQPPHGKANVRKVEELPWHLVESHAWTRLRNLLADPPFFIIAWDLTPEDIKRYWSRFQIALPDVRLNSVYGDVLAAPHRYDAKFLEGVGTLFQETGDLGEALLVRRKLRNRAASGENEAIYAGTLGNEAEVLRLRGELRKAYPLQLRAAEILRRQENRLALAKSLVNLALMDSTLGHSERALQGYEEAESFFCALGNFKGQETCKRNRAEIMRDQGKFEVAQHLAEESEMLAIQLNDDAARARSLGIQGDIYRECRDFDRAARLLEKAEHVFRQLSDSDGLANVLAGQGLVMWERAAKAGPGRDQQYLDESMRFHREEEVYWRDIGDPTGLARCLANQAKILGIQRRYDEAVHLCEEAESFGRQSGDRTVLRIISGHRALIRRKRGY